MAKCYTFPIKAMKYVPTIGLEIHAELKTASKMFCSCKNDPDEKKANTNVCPICMGHPGTLPVLNMEAIHNVIKIGVAVGGKIADFTEWDRKNYFYPDIPKGYQISQFAYPLVKAGSISGIELERIHLEEDTASSTHDQHEHSLVNYNRSGVPLMELVTKPVIHDALTASNFAKELQLLLRYLGIGEANLEKGEMRVEANISISSEEDMIAGRFGTKTEVKNLNSFRAAEKAILYEIERQSALLDSGGKVVQETRGWDDKKQETYSQRSKESSHDYRYFPEPDIPKLKISEIKDFSIPKIKAELPELPWEKRDRYTKVLGMTAKEADMFVDSPIVSTYFESIISGFGNDAKKTKLATNYFLTDYLGILKKTGLEYMAENLGKIAPQNFAKIIEMISVGDLSSRGAKDLIAIMAESDKEADPKVIAESKGLIQKSSAADIIPAIENIISSNEKVVAEYRAGKVASLQFLIGQAMKATKGSANPEVVKKLLVEKLSI